MITGIKASAAPANDIAAEAAPVTRYAYKASLIGAAHQLRTDRRGPVLAHRRQIRGVALQRHWRDPAVYRPVSMQSRAVSRRHRSRRSRAHRNSFDQLADRGADGAAGPGLSCVYRAVAPTDGESRQQGRAGRWPQAVNLCRSDWPLTLVAVRWQDCWFARSMIGEFAGILFLVGFAALFAWQVGGFVARNRPRAYAFDAVPEALLPPLGAAP